MLAQGLPGVSDKEHCSLRRNASFHPRHGHARWRQDRRDSREPSPASFWKEQVWTQSDLASCSGYHHCETDYRIRFTARAVVRTTELFDFWFEPIVFSSRGWDVLRTTPF